MNVYCINTNTGSYDSIKIFSNDIFQMLFFSIKFLICRERMCRRERGGRKEI